jgi:L-arabinokinase
VACLAVVAAAYDAQLSAEEIAEECQWAENRVAGAPCGIMDQMTSACGRRDHLLRLRCQPGRVEGHLPIPAGYRFYGIDSGVSHAVSGADYGTVRTAAFMGYRMIAEMAGLPALHDGARLVVEDTHWHGYLANISPSVFRERYEREFLERMLGADFLARYHGITDTVTSVQPNRWYPVRQATAHPVYENARVAEFATRIEMLHGAASTDVAIAMGGAMYESHASYGACGLGSEGTDRLVQLVAEAGPERGLYGAKITGGGSGGTVAVFGTAAAEPVVREIARRYASETNRSAEVFAKSGPGMAETGVLVLSAGDHQDVRFGSTSA